MRRTAGRWFAASLVSVLVHGAAVAVVFGAAPWQARLPADETPPTLPTVADADPVPGPVRPPIEPEPAFAHLDAIPTIRLPTLGARSAPVTVARHIEATATATPVRVAWDGVAPPAATAIGAAAPVPAVASFAADAIQVAALPAAGRAATVVSAKPPSDERGRVMPGPSATPLSPAGVEGVGADYFLTPIRPAAVAALAPLSAPRAPAMARLEPIRPSPVALPAPAEPIPVAFAAIAADHGVLAVHPGTASGFAPVPSPERTAATSPGFVHLATGGSFQVPAVAPPIVVAAIAAPLPAAAPSAGRRADAAFPAPAEVGAATIVTAGVLAARTAPGATPIVGASAAEPTFATVPVRPRGIPVPAAAATAARLAAPDAARAAAPRAIAARSDATATTVAAGTTIAPPAIHLAAVAPIEVAWGLSPARAAPPVPSDAVSPVPSAPALARHGDAATASRPATAAALLSDAGVTVSARTAPPALRPSVVPVSASQATTVVAEAAPRSPAPADPVAATTASLRLPAYPVPVSAGRAATVVTEAAPRSLAPADPVRAATASVGLRANPVPVSAGQGAIIVAETTPRSPAPSDAIAAATVSPAPPTSAVPFGDGRAAVVLAEVAPRAALPTAVAVAPADLFAADETAIMLARFEIVAPAAVEPTLAMPIATTPGDAAWSWAVGTAGALSPFPIAIAPGFAAAVPDTLPSRNWAPPPAPFAMAEAASGPGQIAALSPRAAPIEARPVNATELAPTPSELRISALAEDVGGPEVTLPKRPPAPAEPVVAAATPRDVAVRAAGAAAGRAAAAAQAAVAYTEAARRWVDATVEAPAWVNATGRTIIDFTVAASGRVVDVTIVETSGNAALDRAAAETIARGALPPIPPAAALAEITIRQSIVFFRP